MPPKTRRQPQKPRKPKHRTRQRRKQGKPWTRRRQRGGQTDPATCKRKGWDWEWVPGARALAFDRFFDCDLSVPGPGGCCRKLGVGEEKCSICWNIAKRSEMKPEGHRHKVCADCWAQSEDHRCPECRKVVRAPVAPREEPEPDWEQLRYAQAPLRPRAARARPRAGADEAWLRQVEDDIERERQEELAQGMHEAAGREEADMARIGQHAAPWGEDDGGGGWWRFW